MFNLLGVFRKIFFQVLKKALRKKTYSLKPVVIIGQYGLTDFVLDDINASLNSHEFIKIRIKGANIINVIKYV